MTARGMLMNGLSLLRLVSSAFGKSLLAGFVIFALSACLVQAFHDADEVALKWKDEKIAAGELNVEWIVTSDRERAKMEAAAAAGMEAIYSDYADRGIQNAQTIYEALNK